MDQILIATQKRLDLVENLKTKDENWGQLDLYGNDCPVMWPCALIDVQSANFSNIGNDYKQLPVNRQEANITVEVTIASIKLNNTSRTAPLKQMVPAFGIWNLVNQVHQVLQGWNPTETSGKFIRTNISKVRRDDGVQEIRVIYTLMVHNC